MFDAIRASNAPAPSAPVPSASSNAPGVGIAPPASRPNLFDTDPTVIQARSLENMGLGQLDAALKAARERAIISFGDPALADQAGFGLDPQAGAFALQNYLSGNSTTARLAKAHDQARQAIINRLVSRGLLRSGDLGYLEGEENTAYGNNVYDAKQKVLDYLAQLQQNDYTQRQSLKNSVLSAFQNAYNNYLQYPQAYAGTPFANTPQASPAGVTSNPYIKKQASKTLLGASRGFAGLRV